jgi:hypothetical protein
MKAIYNSSTNTLTEQPQREKPAIHPSNCDFGSATYNLYYFQWQHYNDHINSLRTIPCDESGRGVFIDGKEYEEGKDYRVTTALLRVEAHPFLAPKEGPFAVPLSPPVQEDKLWEEIIRLITDRFTLGKSIPSIIAELKSKATITKKQ